ncbi:MAG: GHMP kinase [Lentisphaerae bacterium]|nr:GHMP kinase [Lentisphaerota bacterium]
MIIRKQAFPRAALIGNPSDGYYGKTIAFVFDNYSAQVDLYETPELDFVPSLRDHSCFSDVHELVRQVGLYGYYGGIRLLKASVKRFVEYCGKHNIKLHDRNFTMRYRTTIPNRLGLAGSSAIITASILALEEFYEINIDKPELANLVLSVEMDELGIAAGLQDRVAQAYNVPVFMDFNREHMEKFGYGIYKELTIPDDLNLFVAFRTDLAEGSEILHSRLREDYNNGVPAVLDAIAEWAHLTDVVYAALQTRDYGAIDKALRRNFELRCQVCASTVSAKNRRMVELANSLGAAAKLTGSGGAIIGIYEDEKHFQQLKSLFGRNQIDIVKPSIVTCGKGSNDLN